MLHLFLVALSAFVRSLICDFVDVGNVCLGICSCCFFSLIFECRVLFALPSLSTVSVVLGRDNGLFSVGTSCEYLLNCTTNYGFLVAVLVLWSFFVVVAVN